MRPTRSVWLASHSPTGEARTPAAHIVVLAAMISLLGAAPNVTVPALMPVTGMPKRTSTCIASKTRLASRDSVSGNVGSNRGPASTRTMRVVPGMIERKSSRIDARELGNCARQLHARWPAADDDEGQKC